MMASWFKNGNGTVTLIYEHEDSVVVSETDFNRAFGTMLNATRDEVARDYGMHNVQK
jgi:hypothetical protein